MTLNTPKAMARTAESQVTLQVAPHPFSVERVTHALPQGLSLQDMLQAAQPDAVLRRHAHISLNGHLVPRENWARVYPKAGAHVGIRMVPQGGGGGKNPLRTLLSIAVLAASPVLAGGLSAAMGLSGTFLGISTSRLLGAGVSLIGNLALNAIAPPPAQRFSQGRQEAPVYFLQGAQNRVNPFGRVPKVLGRHRYVPPYGALPYTETVGDNQYLRLLFIWGYGPLQISDLKIGETPLSEFDDVEVETRQGYAGEPPLSLYSNAVLQNDLQVTLRHDDGYVLRTSEAEAEEISVDITFPRGLFYFNGSGGKSSRTVELEVQYAPAGTSDWSAGAESFKTIAAISGLASPRPEPYVTGGSSVVVSRIDIVAIDAASGVVKIYNGTPARAGIDAAAQAPAVPPGMRKLARILRRSDQPDVIPAGAITDCRGESFAFSSFAATGDFVVSAGTTAHTLDVAAGGLKYRPLVLTARQATTMRRSVSFKVPKGTYDVRLRRITADSTDDNIFDECAWTALRVVRGSTPVRMPGVAMTALRIKATDQLNGVVERFNGVVEAIIPDWTGSGWVYQPTSNPASIYRHILQGAGNARPLPDDRLDMVRLQEWHTRCRLAGREYNGVVDYDVSVREVMQDVAAVGRASPAVIDGRWSVVEDLPQDVPVQHFTPRNTFSFEGQKAFDDLPEALRIRFVNREKGWTQDERLVFADGVSEQTAQRYETLQLPGVTSPDQAWRDGRYHLATARLRPETYQFSVDIEHLVCTRGDLVRLTHDVPMFGLASARVKALLPGEDGQIEGVVLDTQVSQDAGRNYSVRFRKSDGASLVCALQNGGDATDHLVFATPLAAEAAPQAGDLAMYGEAGLESVSLIVKGIVPQGDLTARMTCIDAAPGVHLAETGAIPPHASYITLPDSLRVPPAPEVMSIQSGEESLIRNTDGSLTTRIVLTLKPVSFSADISLQAMIRSEDEDAFRPADILSETPTQISIVGVEEGATYDLQLRYVTPYNSRSQAKLIVGYQVMGTAALPSNVAGLQSTVLGDTLHLSWQAVGDIDLSHYVLRYTPQTGSIGWANAIDIVSRIAMDTTALSLPVAAGTYLLKAVDVGGRLSAEPASTTVAAGQIAGYNAIIDIDESAGFNGEKSGIARIAGTLRLDGADTIDGWDDIDVIDNIDSGDAGLLSEGVYHFSQNVDLGGVFTSRVTAMLNVEGVDLNQTTDRWANTDAIENWDENIDPSLWSAVIELRMTQEDPAVESTWGGWQTLVVGDYTARAYQFRLRLQSHAENISPVITLLRVLVDMPDRNESAADITSGLLPATVSFEAAFHAAPAVAVTPRDMQAGDYYQMLDVREDGFDIAFFDGSGAAVSRRFDYVAQGYGYRS